MENCCKDWLIFPCHDYDMWCIMIEEKIRLQSFICLVSWSKRKSDYDHLSCIMIKMKMRFNMIISLASWSKRKSDDDHLSCIMIKENIRIWSFFLCHNQREKHDCDHLCHIITIEEKTYEQLCWLSWSKYLYHDRRETCLWSFCVDNDRRENPELALFLQSF